MAVQKNRKSPSKRGMRRAHHALTAPALGFDPESSEQHRRHHLTPNGYYRGRQVIVPPAAENEDDD